MKILKRVVFALGTIFCASLGLMAAYIPHIFDVLVEGFPPKVLSIDTDLPSSKLALVPGSTKHLETNAEFRPSVPLLRLLKSSKTNAFLVFHERKLRYEYYSDGFNNKTRFNSFSLAKSLVAVLVFKAIADKQIGGLEDKATWYLNSNEFVGIGDVTIRQLLEMRAGINFEKRSSKPRSARDQKGVDLCLLNPASNMAKLHVRGLASVADDLRVTPGRENVFDYQNVNTALLGAIVEKVYDKSLNALLSKFLWQPSGAGDAHWRRYSANASVSPYCCIHATARDWLKVTDFIAKNGNEKNRLLPDHLWRQLLGRDLEQKLLTKGHYGYHIRHDILDRKGEEIQGPFAYFMGLGGQMIWLMPEKDLIIVRFGDKHQLLHSTMYFVWRDLQK